MGVIVNMERNEVFRNTPCAMCGHGHAGSDRFWNHSTRTFVERCGEWLSRFTLERGAFWACECPEWRQPPHRCRCGATSLKPFPAWLNGARACSLGCAIGRRG